MWVVLVRGGSIGAKLQELVAAIVGTVSIADPCGHGVLQGMPSQHLSLGRWVVGAEFSPSCRALPGIKEVGRRC
jgi:hypothetical protein